MSIEDLIIRIGHYKNYPFMVNLKVSQFDLQIWAMTLNLCYQQSNQEMNEIFFFLNAQFNVGIEPKRIFFT